MARLQFCDYHNMVAVLEKGEFNSDFHPMVDFIAASPLRYALTVKPTIFVSHIRLFWSTARIETTDEGTHILATVDGIQRTVSESSLRHNLKLRDEDGIVSIPDTELFENLTLMGIVPLFDTMLEHQGEGSGAPTEPHHTPSPEADTSHPTPSSIPFPSVPTAPIPLVTQPDTTPIRQYSRRARIAQYSALPTVADEPASPVRDVSKGEACPTDSGFIADQDKATIAKSSTLPHDSAPRGRSINEEEAAAKRICNDSEEIARVLTSMDAATILAGGIDVPTGSGFIPTAGPPATIISTGSEVGHTASLIVTRRKGKEVMVESDTPKKKKLQEQIDAQVEDFIPMGSKEETERLKRKGLNLEKEQVKKQKLSEEAPKIETSTKEFTEEKIKEMMQLVPVEDVYVQALQVKHPIIDWKVHTEGQRSYWQIIRLGGSSACYQFFIDLLKQLDRDDLNQLWALYKFPLPVKVVTTVRRLEMPLPEVCTAIEEKKKKLPVKVRWQLH
nr:hypothetical protein [Tanacetum cinerariifolium]